MHYEAAHLGNDVTVSVFENDCSALSFDFYLVACNKVADILDDINEFADFFLSTCIIYVRLPLSLKLPLFTMSISSKMSKSR